MVISKWAFGMSLAFSYQNDPCKIWPTNVGGISHDGSQDLHLKVDPHFAPYDAQGSAGHPKKSKRRNTTTRRAEDRMCIYIYPRGRRFTGNSCPKGVYIYEVGVGLGWGGVGMVTFLELAHMVGATQHHVPCTCTHGRCYASHGMGWGWGGVGWGW